MPESELWVSIVAVAFEDAIKRPNKLTRMSNGKLESNLNYVIRPARDFILVCLCAGVDAHAISDKTKRIVAGIDPPPDMDAIQNFRRQIADQKRTCHVDH